MISLLETDAVQRGFKCQLKVATAGCETEMRQAYVTASGMLDTGIAAGNKTSSAAKVFQRLRSKIRQAVAEPLPVPVPEAMK